MAIFLQRLLTRSTLCRTARSRALEDALQYRLQYGAPDKLWSLY